MARSPEPPVSREEKVRVRVTALQAMAGIETPPQVALNVLTKLAAAVCDTPIALVSLIDGERLCFQATFGLIATGVDRASSFCSGITDASQFLEVPDALEDPRFCNISIVTGELV